MDSATGGSGGISRRALLKGVLGAGGLLAGAGAARRHGGASAQAAGLGGAHEGAHGMDPGHMNVAGERGTDGFDPLAFAVSFDYGRVTRGLDGRTLREYDVVATERELEIAPGVWFPAWTYNGTVPGPTLRCTEGDRVRVNFVNAGSHPHTIHFHGIHKAEMDGVFEVVAPGGSFTYEFDAEPFGLHLYHCHAIPLKRHIHKGLYGTFLIDPKQGRPEARELVMVMNGFDTNFDGENEVYAVNTVPFAYQSTPIQLRVGELARVYLVNLTEFDLINSFHLHGNFFRLFRTGTDLERHEWTDTVMLCQGERAVLEFSFRYPGRYMFHAHQSEFAELGWMGVFDVKEATHV